MSRQLERQWCFLLLERVWVAIAVWGDQRFGAT
jgi:hypothetical protein